MKRKHQHVLCRLLAAGWLLAGGVGLAEADDVIPCPTNREPVNGRPLEQPRIIRPVSGTVNTSLTMRMVKHECVPVWVSQDANGNNIPDPHWEWQSMTLRTYGSPANGNNPNDPNLLWMSPGPAFRVRKALLKDDTQPPGPNNPQIADGTRFNLLLRNQLPNNSYPYHDCQPATAQQPPPPGCSEACCKGTGTNCPSGCDPTACKTFVQQAPECFHGADLTNIHYHGSHVSPQPHQDFVLLELFSSLQKNPPPPPVSETVAVGQYQTSLNPFPWNQPPGTHWYHPHKHGSTALQVLNGIAGPLLIAGPFDDWLYSLYKVNPDNDPQIQTFEKVLVVHQQWPELNFFKRPHPNYPPPPLINGQAEPAIPIRYGEVQRWRFIGATMQASAQLTICFDSLINAGYQVRQIAQDGVQFAVENWNDQPLLVAAQNPTCAKSYNLAPGNRADFLVQAPPPPATNAPVLKQSHPVFFGNFGNVAEDIRDHLQRQRETRQRLRLRAKAGQQLTAAQTQSAVLFTVELDGVTTAMALPTNWPPMPYFLRDIQKAEVSNERTLAFSMTDPATGVPTTPGTQPNGFWIDKTQYDPDCANQTMAIGTAERWTITNDSPPNHPFHIHINPFQLVRNDGTTYKKPIWGDTIALPTGGCADVDAGPLFNQQEAEAKCPGVCKGQGQVWNGQWTTTVQGQQSVCGCCTVKSVEFLARFEDYTGGYVYHCHFLGHEDRGMMHNTQTVCPGGTPDQWKYGKTNPTGRGDDCGQTATSKPLPACKPYTPGAKNEHQGHH